MNPPQPAKSDTSPKTGTPIQKDPNEWTTGNEPMTPAQKSYLKTLSEQAHMELDENLTKAEASKKIDELRAKVGLAKPRQSKS